MIRIITPTEDVKVPWPSICPWSNFDFSCSIRKQKPIIVLLFIKNFFIYSFIYNFKTCYQARKKCPLSAVTRLRQELTTSSQLFFLRDSRASKTRAHVYIIPCEKGDTRWGGGKMSSHHRVSPFSRGVIFSRARVSMRKNGGPLVV